MTEYAENYMPYVKQNKGYNSKYPISAPQTTLINSGQASTVTLTSTQSGNTFLFDSAAGIVYTLPAATVGLRFTFTVTVSVTSNADKVITSGGAFLIGALDEATANGAPTLFTGNGSTHISVSANGTTTGGLQGSTWNFVCVTTGLWQVTGTNIASGTIATPFATS